MEFGIVCSSADCQEEIREFVRHRIALERNNEFVLSSHFADLHRRSSIQDDSNFEVILLFCSLILVFFLYLSLIRKGCISVDAVRKRRAARETPQEIYVATVAFPSPPHPSISSRHNSISSTEPGTPVYELPPRYSSLDNREEGKPPTYEMAVAVQSRSFENVV